MRTKVEIRGSLLARNSLLNLLGTAIPLLVGVVTIPFIVRGLGTERFGLLSPVNRPWLAQIFEHAALDDGIARACPRSWVHDARGCRPSELHDATVTHCANESQRRMRACKT